MASLGDTINSFRQQGYQDGQIVQYLTTQGYAQNDIYAAMGKSAPPAAPPSGAPPPPPSNTAEGAATREQIEEVAEAVVEEKWKTLLEKLNTLTEWKDDTQTRLAQIEQDVKNIQTSFDSLHKGVLGKISEYDKNLTDVGTSIKAMDKVFKEVIPTFTENVNKLDRIARSPGMSPRVASRPR
ncbi:MAG: hypothetical protein KJ601_01715 [Nanoarchaeota archaeon]|nr:hypothetical protein [Nanoarchaeota archaeon]MBU1705024.1 hypothetical protein [Nanoarchaeota archaeon]